MKPLWSLRLLNPSFDQTVYSVRCSQPQITCSSLCKQASYFIVSSATNYWLRSRLVHRQRYQRQYRLFKAELYPARWVLLYPRSILPVQLLQAASAGSNYHVSVPVKEILFASMTLSSSPEQQQGRSSNVGLISVNRGKRWRRAREQAAIPWRSSAITSWGLLDSFHVVEIYLQN